MAWSNTTETKQYIEAKVADKKKRKKKEKKRKEKKRKEKKKRRSAIGERRVKITVFNGVMAEPVFANTLMVLSEREKAIYCLFSTLVRWVYM